MATYGGGDWWSNGNTYLTTSATSSSWPCPAIDYYPQLPQPAPTPARVLTDREWLDSRIEAVIAA